MGVSSGCLYVVATPIGNLGDLSPRAVSTLRQVDLILAEDTRVTRRLLHAHGIATPMQSFHEHIERRAAASALERLREGASIALLSDAGTPLVSDPGRDLVAGAHADGIRVSPVPGPSAVTAALSVAGVGTRPFWFEGFLPPRAEARRARLRALAGVEATLVFFEAPHRVAACLADMVQVLGAERMGAIARELTKLHEEVRAAPLGVLDGHVHAGQARGEYVLVVEAAPPTDVEEAELRRVLECLLDSLPTRAAAAMAARITGAKRNRAYALALSLLRSAN